MPLGPIQLRKHLDMPEWQFTRALQLGLIPGSTGGKWADTTVTELTGRRDAIVAAAGSIPDCGAYLAAQHLSERFGREIPAHAIYDLHRLGHIPITGDFKGVALYSGRALQSFNDTAALDRAIIDGQLYTTADAVAYLRIRRSDFGWLLKLGLLTPTRWAYSQHQSYRNAPNVALYRAADLDRILHDDRIDWDEVRAVPEGARSVFASLRGAA